MLIKLDHEIEDDIMVSILPRGKEFTVVHLNADWGYIAYIEKCNNEYGETQYKVRKVSLEGKYGEKGAKSSS
jgi:hypothetical protein